MIYPCISVTASLMLFVATPLLYVVTHALVESIPASMVPIPSFNSELPFSIFDAYNGASLLCSIVPPVVLSNPAAGSGGIWITVNTRSVFAHFCPWNDKDTNEQHPQRVSYQYPELLTVRGECYN
ncbi:hypothetical protein BKA82DRAFT_772008 [Pisolithus tinctorius]|uniref:Uncharacterized protein n=1 Tax=Pisolithus tinctorius Marx 270 TaxID=870435 RepID=A0A0C3NXZ7_PISTI|nr:hypothetical protein BKA82DRAFT_772008 [Pisolithus tinctorius]KIO00201.1 hypothetical protein M404DRAFT_772008 [Pisolithus tinctorius Marx 270]